MEMKADIKPIAIELVIDVAQYQAIASHPICWRHYNDDECGRGERRVRVLGALAADGVGGMAFAWASGFHDPGVSG